jgi:hypothetical protein
MDDRGIGIGSFEGVKNISLLKTVHIGSGAHRPLCVIGKGISISGGKVVVA